MMTAIYIFLIVAVNYGFTVVPLIPTPWGEMFPPMSFAVGLVFVARDFAQREIGHMDALGDAKAMLAAGALSYFMASPYVAIASVTAFAISEFADYLIYTWTRKPFAQRVLLSSAIATPIDSAVFLAIIGHFSIAGVVAMTLAKMVGAFIVWNVVRRREADA